MRPISAGIFFFVSIITGFALAILFVVKNQPKTCSGICDLKGEFCTCPNYTSCDSKTLMCKSTSNRENKILNSPVIKTESTPSAFSEIQTIEIVPPAPNPFSFPQAQDTEIVPPAHNK